MDVSIRFVTDPEEKEAVYRFRYRVYVEEMQRPQTYADHARKRIEESLDHTGALLAAFAGDAVVGTLRNNFARHGGLGYYESLYGFDRAGGAYPHGVSMTTKLMVAPAWRRTSLPRDLSVRIYEYALREGIRFDFIDCNAHLERFFTHLGYTRSGENLRHPEYGEVIPMALDLRDAEHLAAVGSPFVGSLLAHLQPPAAFAAV